MKNKIFNSVAGPQDYEFENEENSELLEDNENNAEWENRVLCDDGNCIGVIGPDGLCKECGKAYEGNEEIFGSGETKDTSKPSAPEEKPVADFGETFSDDQDKSAGLENEATEKSDKDDRADSDEDWESRKLCSDGNCIGVIGSDGRCKECGKPYEG
jgi:hypothetical protein